MTCRKDDRVEDDSMNEKKFKRIVRPASAEDRKRHAEIRQKVMQEFPPAEGAGRQESPPGIPTQVRQAREAQNLTWYALAKLAGIPNANTVRDIEYGRDAQISSVHAVAKALGLRLELVEETV
jgi:hypothetical protein